MSALKKSVQWLPAAVLWFAGFYLAVRGAMLMESVEQGIVSWQSGLVGAALAFIGAAALIKAIRMGNQ